MPKHEQWLRREAFVRTVYSSTMIENADITEKELEETARPSPVATVSKERPDVANYAQALEFVDFISQSADVPLTESLIRQLHWFLMKGINERRVVPGHYRTEPNWIEDQGIKVFEPPSHIDVPTLMAQFSDWLGREDSLNPILRAGVAHAHLFGIHPFLDGNGRTARLLAIHLLQRSGYGFRNLLSLDAYYQRNRDGYLQALRDSLGSRFSAGYDCTKWLEFFTLSVVLQARSLEERLTDWRMMVDRIHERLRTRGLSERQIDGLIYASHCGSITRKDYIEITGVSPLTATRDLADLATMKLLAPKGAGRNRVYAYTGPREAKGDKAEQSALL
ncbi:MAG: Fic family protein [Chloroflexi bacterium]|nr:Fic family protein [Chloroflexota bacterium]